ncbi:Metal-activated transcriptional activator protein AMT1 [Wickerhamomyces ciferrii]|uniref:Metal-activated transcriptional activator protein AMT1 n=1 Tax=Wickerhamomyces ciferrii (strain ATCC 14091 / BCRC 22168 / CBS 111 / JCM 3599 / NBRC 0793 / NRRL Y-1031 F-60-10) TaxID=1206466 RepID=K0KY60_WICCF|nr:Metal-activated transcriptional activator protein AMT1 [Wickerhamomyces ciferrii]CCH46038.1 Metal-activated transcriptional activator protein AMT1 [Wickerhamomyces ciferrii]
MILLHNERLACEQCIRGHRAADCQHLNKSLISIKGRGRPPAKDLSVRYKVDPFPNIISQTWEPIESKNGRGRPGAKKFCFHVDPETPVETYQVKLGKGFLVIGPYDPPPDFKYQGAFRIRRHVKGRTVISPMNTFGESSPKKNGLRSQGAGVRKPRKSRAKKHTKTEAQNAELNVAQSVNNNAANQTYQVNNQLQPPQPYPQQLDNQYNGQYQFQVQPQVQGQQQYTQNFEQSQPQPQTQSRFQIDPPDYLQYANQQQDHTSNFFKSIDQNRGNNNTSPGNNSDVTAVEDDTFSSPFDEYPVYDNRNNGGMDQNQRASISSQSSNITLTGAPDFENTYSSLNYITTQNNMNDLELLSDLDADPHSGIINPNQFDAGPSIDPSNVQLNSDDFGFQQHLTVGDEFLAFEEAALRDTDKESNLPSTSVNTFLGELHLTDDLFGHYPH